MKVIATQRGYYGNVVRQPGDEFVLADEAAFTDVWMEKADNGDGSEWSSLTVAELREMLPDAPANALKADLVALAEASGASRDPLDHDGDGRKGGSKPKAQVKETDVKPPVEPAKSTDPVTGDEI